MRASKDGGGCGGNKALVSLSSLEVRADIKGNRAPFRTYVKRSFKEGYHIAELGSMNIQESRRR